MALTKITSNIITDGAITTDDLATATIASISGSGNQSSSSLASRVTVTEASSSNINQDVKSSASPTFAGGTITGDFSVGGILTAQEFHTEFESASIIYTSGSNKFGDSSDDVHHMSGSLRITGSGDHYIQTGNVGIDQTSPSSFYSGASNLVIGNTSQAESGLTIVSSGGASSYGEIFFADGTTGNQAYRGFIQYNHDNSTDSLLFGTAGSEKMRIDSSGNVAIGGHSPSSRLDVRGNSSIVGFGTDSSADFGETYFASGVAINFGYGTNSNSGGFINYRGYQNGDTQFRDLTIADGKGGTVAFFDGSAKYVGIGTTSPQKILHLENSSPYTYYKDTDDNKVWVTGVGASRYNIYEDNTNLRFTVEAGGNVGIGTDNPAETLHIESSANTSVRITETGGGQVKLFAPGGGFVIRGEDTNGYTRFDLNVGGSNTEIMRVTTNGLTFGGETASDHALDDYEEGVWTPLIKDTSDNAVTNSSASGKFIKIGNLCHVQFDFTVSSLGSASGNVVITGLPFTSKDFGGNAGRAGASFGFAASLAITAGTNIAGFVETNATWIVLTEWTTSTGIEYVQASDISTGGRLIGSVMYITA